MNTNPPAATGSGLPASAASASPEVHTFHRHIVEVVSDSGEGAQKCGQSFGLVSARMGNGAWTVEIIPAEIQPPPRTPGSASGVRIRIGSEPVTNWGDEADLIVAFNEQVLLARHRLGALKRGATILLESMWETHEDADIRRAWDEAMRELADGDYHFVLVPMEEQTLTITENPQRGKNMFILGLLSAIHLRDLDIVRDQIRKTFAKKAPEVAESNIKLMELGAAWAEQNVGFRIDVPCKKPDKAMVVMNGNQAIGMGAMASGMDLCAMYPITPATSVSHYLSDVFETSGGIVHQAEDEIAAIGVAIGASYAGKIAFTVTSGPGMALKTEFIGLAIMTETPLVIVDVQRGGPSTGLPTKVEQSDLLAALFGQPGDAPKVVMAPATIEECFHCMVSARQIAESLRGVVIVLTDANLATGVQPFPRPELDPHWQAHLPDLGPIPQDRKPFSWDEQTGLSKRIVPGQPDGMHTTTGLAHDEASTVTYAPDVNMHANAMRSRKLAVFQQTLRPPPVYGGDEGDLLVVGWGSTKGAIEEAVDRAREQGLAVSSTHLTFLSPMQPGLKDIFRRFSRVMTVEINYSDQPGDPFITPENRRYGQLCLLLRAQTLVDIDCWTRVPGEPLRPGQILEVMRAKLATDGKETA